jgi:hypothetical protein
MSILDRAVVFAVDFKPRIVGGLSVMPNHGRAGGAPTWLRLGDGSTASTFPIPLAGYGANFTGFEYVETGVIDRYEWNSTFSLYWYGANKNLDRYCISTSNGAYKGFMLYASNPDVYTYFASSNAFGSNYIQARTAERQYPLKSRAVAYNAGTVAIYASCVLQAIATFGTVSATIKNGLGITLGRRAGASGSITGLSYAFGIFDGLLQPADISTLDTLVLSGVR